MKEIRLGGNEREIDRSSLRVGGVVSNSLRRVALVVDNIFMMDASNHKLPGRS